MNLSFLTGQIEKIEVYPDDKAVIQIVSMAKTKGAVKYDTHRLLAFGRVGEFVGANFKAGDVVFVQARLQSRKNFVGTEVRYETEVVIWTIYRINGSTNC